MAIALKISISEFGHTEKSLFAKVTLFFLVLTLLSPQQDNVCFDVNL